MIRGNIDFKFTEYDRDILVVDYELLFSITRKFLFIKKFAVNDFNRKVIKYIRNLRKQKNFDIVFVPVLKYRDYADYILNSVLVLDVSVIDIGSEFNYSNWIKSITPKLHLAVQKREYYSKKSLWLNESSIETTYIS